MPPVKGLIRQIAPPVAYTYAQRVKRRLTAGANVPLGQQVSPSGVILAGPFAGMRLGETVIWGDSAPYLAGTYEDELHPHIEAAVAAGPSTVVVIGAAEGYYAQGMAKRLPDARVVAFEMDRARRELCAENAVLNAVAVEVEGECTPDTLRPLVGNGTMVICDCEGAELDLLDPGSLTGLAETSIIVETHDFVDPEISGTLETRFAPTHEIEWVAAAPKTPRRYDHLSHLPASVAWSAVQEHRPCVMEWAVMTPKGR